MASSFFNTCCREGGREEQELDEASETGQQTKGSASDLLGSPLVAQRPELARVRGTDLVQRRQVPGEIRPKVLCGFREVRDVLCTAQWTLC